MRPVLIDINQRLAAQPHGPRSRPLRCELMARAAADQRHHRSGRRRADLRRRRGRGASASTCSSRSRVAFDDQLELSMLLTRRSCARSAISSRPSSAVERGRYDVSVPVTTADELGELSAGFNQMVAGLAERERIREAFGTYLDREVAEYILSEGFSAGGRRGRGLAAVLRRARLHPLRGRRRRRRRSSPALNEPVRGRRADRRPPRRPRRQVRSATACWRCSARRSRFADHADRAVRAAVEIAAAVNDDGAPAAPDRRSGSTRGRSSPARSAAPAGSTSASSATRSTSPPGSRRRRGRSTTTS